MVEPPAARGGGGQREFLVLVKVAAGRIDAALPLDRDCEVIGARFGFVRLARLVGLANAAAVPAWRSVGAPCMISFASSS